MHKGSVLESLKYSKLNFQVDTVHSPAAPKSYHKKLSSMKDSLDQQLQKKMSADNKKPNEAMEEMEDIAFDSQPRRLETRQTEEHGVKFYGAD